ncbi:GntR family transcriptional regulator [Deltaproteobacteria bacterium]|nr:GntR family transcriptional regulator [Deltaproteobacteria bacterium]
MIKTPARRLQNKAHTIADAIYNSLKESILHLEFAPGEKISELQLAEIYGVSKAPVRDALQRLQQESLVQIRPQAGTIISPAPSRKKAMEICRIRYLLEPYAAGIAASVIGEEDKAALHAAFAEMEPRKNDEEAYAAVHKKVDILLHSTIWRLSGNNEIVTILTNYQHEVHRIRVTTARLVTARLRDSVEEHKAILDALSRNDEKACFANMGVHIQNLQQAVIKVFDEQENNPQEVPV